MSEPDRNIKLEPVTPINREVYEVLVLDQSGSMGIVKEATLKGVNDSLDKLRDDAKALNMQTFVSLILFDSAIKTVFNFLPIAEIPTITPEMYNPEGMTALADGIGEGIEQLRERLAGREGADEVSVTITAFTDGYENASRKYSMDQIKNLTKELETTFKWTFTMVGAGTAEQVAQSASLLGIQANNTSNYSFGAEGVSASFASMSSARSAKMYAFDKGLKSTTGYFTNAGVDPAVSTMPDTTALIAGATTKTTTDKK